MQECMHADGVAEAKLLACLSPYSIPWSLIALSHECLCFSLYETCHSSRMSCLPWPVKERKVYLQLLFRASCSAALLLLPSVPPSLCRLLHKFLVRSLNPQSMVGSLQGFGAVVPLPGPFAASRTVRT